MKLGCAGCVSLVVGLAIVVLVLSSMLGISARMLAQPALPPILTTPGDGPRARQKLCALTRRRRGPAETVVITEAEVNALLSRHLVKARGVQLGAPSARLLGGDRTRLTGDATA